MNKRVGYVSRDMELSIRIPSDRENGYFDAKNEKKKKIKKARPDWTIGSYIGCCIARYGEITTRPLCYRCKMMNGWRQTFYEYNEEDEEYRHLLQHFSKWKKAI